MEGTTEPGDAKWRDAMIEGSQGTRDDLTKHVATRWYRAPEIILLENYDYNSDIWSAGCILAELLGLISPESLRGPLFEGQSCYPLSPYKKTYDHTAYTKIVMDNKDQMNLILNIVGKSEEDCRFIKNQTARNYLINFKDRPRIEFRNFYPKANDLTYDLLVRMLTFNPMKRPNAKWCLEHRCFTLLPSLFVSSPENTKTMIVSDFESNTHALHLDPMDLRMLFIREYVKFNPQTEIPESFQESLRELLNLIAESHNW